MTVKVRPRSNAAKRIRRELGRMLADAASRTGQTLEWDHTMSREPSRDARYATRKSPFSA